MDSTPVQLALLKQSSLTEDSISKNGSSRVIHVVVKNSPFSITFGFPNSSVSSSVSTDLHDYNVEAKLLYDSDLEKDVDFVKAKPLLAKITLNQTGSKMTVEGRIKVLTSQLENSLFRMGIFVYDRQTKELAFPITYSEAIKVISKSDQVKKKKVTEHEEEKKKKRNISDVLSDALEYIEAKQSEQVELLENLMENTEYNVSELLKAVDSAPNNQDLSNLQTTFRSSDHDHSLDACEKPFETTSPTENFEKAFKTFLSSYTQLHVLEKPAKIRKVVSTTSDMSDFVELLDLFWAEGLSREASSNMQQKVPQSSEIGHSHVCPCHECPYKKELVRIENFYDDIFAQQQQQSTPFAFSKPEIGMEQLSE